MPVRISVDKQNIKYTLYSAVSRKISKLSGVMLLLILAVPNEFQNLFLTISNEILGFILSRNFISYPLINSVSPSGNVYI